MNSVLLEEKAMSKDMLGSVVRAAVGVPQDRLDLLAKIASKLSIERPKDQSEGEVWHAYFRKLMEQELPDWAYLLNVLPTVIELGEFAVNYDKTTAQKLQSDATRKLIQSGDFIDKYRNLSTGMFRRAERTGVVLYKASAVSFNAYLKRQVIEEWGRQNKKVMAGVEECIDIAVATPTLKLAHTLPLVMLGECRWDTFEYAYVPSFREAVNKLELGFERFDDGQTPTRWSKDWKFLALEELQPSV